MVWKGLNRKGIENVCDYMSIFVEEYVRINRIEYVLLPIGISHHGLIMLVNRILLEYLAIRRVSY